MWSTKMLAADKFVMDDEGQIVRGVWIVPSVPSEEPDEQPEQPEVAHRLILMPYVESFWQYAAKESRFAFRSPDLAVAAIEAAVRGPEAKRVQAILMAAASGFRIQGLQDVLHSLRKTLGDMTVITAQEHQ